MIRSLTQPLPQKNTYYQAPSRSADPANICGKGEILDWSGNPKEKRGRKFNDSRFRWEGASSCWIYASDANEGWQVVVLLSYPPTLTLRYYDLVKDADLAIMKEQLQHLTSANIALEAEFVSVKNDRPSRVRYLQAALFVRVEGKDALLQHVLASQNANPELKNDNMYPDLEPYSSVRSPRQGN